ncbi:uncharacterized protein [Phyllobates terribilis]|uniref:uncharacterized protein isoform X2 n=1 Tax=Phyllobates terribilis TaxID=111132 RepID=UPI003CCAFB3E
MGGEVWKKLQVARMKRSAGAHVSIIHLCRAVGMGHPILCMPWATGRTLIHPCPRAVSVTAVHCFFHQSACETADVMTSFHRISCALQRVSASGSEVKLKLLALKLTEQPMTRDLRT